MDREAFRVVKHGELIDSVRTSHPQVVEFAVHEVTAPEGHPLANSEHAFAVAEQSMGKSIGFIAINGNKNASVPEVRVAKHPNFPHMDKSLRDQVLPVALGHSGYTGVQLADITVQDMGTSAEQL